MKTITAFVTVFTIGLMIWAMQEKIALAQSPSPVEIVSSTPMGMRCAGVEQFGCQESNNGWLVVVRGSANLYRATLRYREPSGETKTITAVDAASTNGLTAIALRAGRFLPVQDVLDLTITEFREGATIKQDQTGVVITPGPTVFGPPIH